MPFARRMQSSLLPADWLTETTPADRDESHAITQWYYHEARLLDAERWRDWLALLDPDIQYWMPMRENRLRRDPRGLAPDPGDTALFDDRFNDLEDRVRRLETGAVWTEDPPVRIRRLIVNLSAFVLEADGERRVYSHFLIHRSRRQDDQATLVGIRRDLLKRHGDGYLLARREVLLDQHVVLDKNLYLFF